MANGSENGTISLNVKRWHFFMAILTFVFLIATSFLRGYVGFDRDAAILRQTVTRLEIENQEIRRDYARKDVTEERLKSIEGKIDSLNAQTIRINAILDRIEGRVGR